MRTEAQPVREDMHVHSTFSDGRNTIPENVAEAELIGLSRLRCVDHVRESTGWVLDFVAAVRACALETGVELTCGVEAKLLSTAGDLDVPPDFGRADVVYAADHQVPLDDGPHRPDEIRELLDGGQLSGADVIEALLTATEAVLRRYPSVVLAHLFSVLPKLGLGEDDVPPGQLNALARTAGANGAVIEISERWSCPSARTIAAFLEEGVPVLFSTDSHGRETIGRYAYCPDTLRRAGELRDARALSRGRA